MFPDQSTYRSGALLGQKEEGDKSSPGTLSSISPYSLDNERGIKGEKLALSLEGV
jgi:hypothetical protein